MLTSPIKAAACRPVSRLRVAEEISADSQRGKAASPELPCHFVRFFGPKLRAAAAFTLVELLVVMSIIVVLIGMMVPVFKNLVGGRGMQSSIDSVTSFLELGRATAIANQTYVTMFVKNVVNSDGSYEMRCVGVMSTTSLNTFDPKYLKPITKLIKIPGVKNVKFSQLPTAVKNVTPADLAGDGSFIAGYWNSETGSNFKNDLIVDGENFNGATYFGFSRDGELGTDGASDPYALLTEPKICLGLITTRGSNVATNTSDGAIVAAYGPSGGIRVIRP